MGHKQTLTDARVTSAFPPKADILQRGGNVRFVPNLVNVANSPSVFRDRQLPRVH
jgi:hypothetical protein